MYDSISYVSYNFWENNKLNDIIKIDKNNTQ